MPAPSASVLGLQQPDLAGPRLDLDRPVPVADRPDHHRPRVEAHAHADLDAALERSIAVPLFFPPQRDAHGVWCDAGPWESIPVAPSRAWAPDAPVIGVWADVPKPAFLAGRVGGTWLRLAAARLQPRDDDERLTARRYLSLLARRWADPVHVEPPDLLIAPSNAIADRVARTRQAQMTGT